MVHVCLAAGKGTRLGNLGRYLQKCMYPIGTRPFLDYTVRNLLKSPHLSAADRLIIVVGHHGEQVRAYFGSAVDGLPVSYLDQGTPRGTGHALKAVAGAVAGDEPAIVWLADLYLESAHFAACAAHPAAQLLTLAPAPPGFDPDIRVAVAEGRVVRAWRGGGRYVDIGLWKFTGATMARLAEVGNSEYRVLPNLQRLIDAGLDVGAGYADAWIHLGGTHPTAHDNVLAVVDRLRNLGGSP